MTEENEPSMESVLASIRTIMTEEEEAATSEAPAAEKLPAEQSPAEDKQKASEPEIQEKPATEELSVKPDPEPVSEPIPAPVPEPEQKQPLLSETTEVPSLDPAIKEQEEDILNLTADMIVDEQTLETESIKKENEVPENKEKELPEEEEDDFTPEPVIPQQPMKEETLNDLIKENVSFSYQEEDEDALLTEPAVVAATESLSHLRDIAVGKQLSLGQGNLTIEAIVRETLKPYLKEWLNIHLPEIVERVVKKEVAHIMDRLDLK